MIGEVGGGFVDGGKGRSYQDEHASKLALLADYSYGGPLPQI